MRARLSPIGLAGIDLETGLAGGLPDAPPAYTMIARFRFARPDGLQNAFATYGPELIGDIPNFTDGQPIMQVSQFL